MQRIMYACSLAAVGLIAIGCRVDQTTKNAERIDSSSVDTRATTNYPSHQASPSTSAPPTTAAPSQAAPAANLPLAATHDARPLVVCFGDSLTSGYGADPGNSYPDFLQADLDRRGYRYRVVNEGIGGNTTKDGVDRVAAVIALKPAAVVLEFGGNDGLRGLRVEDSRANLDTMLAKLTQAHIKVMLAGITLPPDYGPDYIAQFNASYVLLAKKYKVPMLPFLLKGVFGVPGMMQADRTHATDAGNKVVARNVMPILTPLLKR